MNLKDKASLIITPNGYSTGKIYADKPTSGLGDLTFARASAQTRRNVAGVIENLANNVPALDYPVVGGCPWWNFPVARTNLFLNSQAPVTQNITVVSGSTYTVSVGAGGSATLSNAGTGSATSTTPFTFVASSTTLTVTIVSLPIWCQVELGTYASPLIVTAGTALTRVIANPNTSGLTSFIGQTEGVFSAIFRTQATVQNGDLLGINQNTTNSILYVVSGGTLRAVIYAGGVGVILIGPTVVANTTYNCAVRYVSGNPRLVVNGVEYTTGTTTFTFSASLTSLNFLNDILIGPRPNVLFGEIGFYPALTNAELVALTTRP